MWSQRDATALSICLGAQVTTGEEGFFVVNTALANADPTGIPSNAQSAGRFWSAKARCFLKPTPHFFKTYFRSMRLSNPQSWKNVRHYNKHYSASIV